MRTNKKIVVAICVPDIMGAGGAETDARSLLMNLGEEFSPVVFSRSAFSPFTSVRLPTYYTMPFARSGIRGRLRVLFFPLMMIVTFLMSLLAFANMRIDLVHVQMGFVSNLPILLSARILKKHILLVVLGPIEINVGPRILLRLLIDAADVVVALDPIILSLLQKLASPRKVVLVPPIIETKIHKYEDPPRGVPVISFFGGDKEGKGLPYLLEVISSVLAETKVKFKLLGRLRDPRLMKRIAELKLRWPSLIESKGVVSHEEVFEVIKKSTCVLGIGKILHESLSCGRRGIVFYDFKNRKLGELWRAHSSEMERGFVLRLNQKRFHESLVKLIKSNRMALSRQEAEAAQRLVKSTYGTAEIVENYRKLYRALIMRPSAVKSLRSGN